MAAGDRSVSDLLQDILRNVQGIVRAEVRLVKTEVWEETIKAKSSALWLGAGTVSAVFAMLFLLLMIMYLLALVMSIWAAALIVGAGLSSSSSQQPGASAFVAAGILLMAGVSRLCVILESVSGPRKRHLATFDSGRECRLPAWRSNVPGIRRFFGTGAV